LKFDRAKKLPYEEEQAHMLSRREKRRKMGLPPTRRDRILGTAGTPRSERVHRMKPEDRPKPRKKDPFDELPEPKTEQEKAIRMLMSPHSRRKPPKMGDRGRQGFRGH
tara:strand:- start:10744 stop:11067 length:324 start_codon:yes stop_codon:yes gene_type:complete